MSITNQIAKKIILPVSDIITGYKINKCLNFLMVSQYWSREQIEKYQNEKLKELIYHAYNYVPYYKDLFANLRINPSDIRSSQDLSKIPILTKKIIREEGIDRFTSNFYEKNKRILRSSSGSTGEPLFYYSTKFAYSMSIAASLRGWYWMGFRLGDKYIKMSQNPRKRLIKQIQDKMSNNMYLAINPLENNNFEVILEKIEKYKPVIIRSYPDPFLFLARYKKQHTEFNYSPKAIATTGNILFPDIRKEIEDAFNCKIFDSYSCEGNSTFFECPTHTCYHSAEEYGISEVLDPSDKPLAKGIGRLVSTDLHNLAHPFIRYDTQDLVDFSNECCTCGRSHLKILKVLGRDNEVLEMDSGRKFIVHNFTGFFQADLPQLNRSVEQFQVIKTRSNVIFRLVVKSHFTNQNSEFIKQFWEKEMKCKVDLEIVDSIPLTEIGKRRFIINE